MADFDESIVKEFVVESKEHLESIEIDLLELEKNPALVEDEKINKIFRAIHSIKGASGFLGFYKLGCLSHVMETILSMIRSGEMLPTSIIIGGLLKGVDCLNTMFDDIDGSNDLEIEDLHAELMEFTGVFLQDCKDTSAPNLNTELVLDDGLFGFTLDDNCLSGLIKNNLFLYSLEYDLAAIAKEDKNLVELVNELEGLGTIIDTIVIRDKLSLKSDDLLSPIITRVLYSTVLDYEMIVEGVCLGQDQINQIDVLKIKIADEVDDSSHDNVTENKIRKVKDIGTNKNVSVKNESIELESIRINVDVLDRLMTLAGELVLVRNQCVQAVDHGLQEEMVNVSQHLDMITTELQEAIMLTRMQPVGNVFSKLPRIVRDLSLKLDKKIEIKTIGNEVEIDKTILQALADPLTHLVRNCCDHAIETSDQRVSVNKLPHGTITIHAYHEAGQINIEVKDNGKGLDVESIKHKALQNEIKTDAELEVMSESEVLSLIMLPGFSTAKEVSDISGRGVGMDVVKSSIEKLGGEVELVSAVGVGTTIHMRLPLTLAIIPSLVVGVNGQRYAIPQVNLEELVSLDHEKDAKGIENTDSQEVFRLRDYLLPIVRFSEVLQESNKFSAEFHSNLIKKYHENQTGVIDKKKDPVVFAVVKVRGQRYGLVVDEVFGTEEIVVKPMHQEMKKYEIYSGATVMGDGKVALILSTEGIAKHAGVKFNITHEDHANVGEIENNENQAVLLFKSGEKEQFAVSMSSISRVERVCANDIAFIGDQKYLTIDGVSTFIFCLDKVLDVSKCIEEEDLFLLLPKESRRPYGILMSSIVEIVEVSSVINTDSYLKKGILGTEIVLDHMTLFLDIGCLIEQADPEWFLEHSRLSKELVSIIK